MSTVPGLLLTSLASLFLLFHSHGLLKIRECYWVTRAFQPEEWLPRQVVDRAKFVENPLAFADD